MQWFDAIRTSVDEDLRPFRRYLSERGVCHHVVEQGGRQVLLLADRRELLSVRRWFEEWRSGRLPLSAAGDDAEASFDWRRASARVRTLIARYPVVVALASLSAAGAWLVWSENLYAVRLLLLEDAAAAVAAGQWWRFVSPAFVHFGIIHLLFNLLWLADLGRRIESSQSSMRLLLVVAVTALCANLSQYWHVPGSAFGGMSGVVYGLLGYCWLAGRRTPRLQLPAGVVAFLLGWMLLCMTGIFSVIGIHVANAAHVGGFVTGLLLALLPPPSAGAGAGERGKTT